MVTSGALPTMTLNGGRPDTSASLPASFSRESSTLPLRSRISTHEVPLKRSVTVRVPGARLVVAAATVAGRTSTGFAGRGASSTGLGAGAETGLVAEAFVAVATPFAGSGLAALGE